MRNKSSFVLTVLLSLIASIAVTTPVSEDHHVKQQSDNNQGALSSDTSLNVHSRSKRSTRRKTYHSYDPFYKRKLLPGNTFDDLDSEETKQDKLSMLHSKHQPASRDSYYVQSDYNAGDYNAYDLVYDEVASPPKLMDISDQSLSENYNEQAVKNNSQWLPNYNRAEAMELLKAISEFAVELHAFIKNGTGVNDEMRNNTKRVLQYRSKGSKDIVSAITGTIKRLTKTIIKVPRLATRPLFTAIEEFKNAVTDLLSTLFGNKKGKKNKTRDEDYDDEGEGEDEYDDHKKKGNKEKDKKDKKDKNDKKDDSKKAKRKGKDYSY